MNIELGISVLSKRESLLGIDLQHHKGVTIIEKELHQESVTEFRIGLIFFIIKIAFVSIGEKLDMPEMDNMKKAMEAFEKELENE
jgi:hypothetical protein